MTTRYASIANDWNLWNEYVNTDATMCRAEFDALTTEQKVALQVDAFGPEPTARFATIDLHTGYVWWVGHADSPADACARSHAETGNTPAEFVECTRSDARAVYAVHEVPTGFDADDGQDADAINATQAHPLAGHFRHA